MSRKTGEKEPPNRKGLGGETLNNKEGGRVKKCEKCKSRNLRFEISDFREESDGIGRMRKVGFPAEEPPNPNGGLEGETKGAKSVKVGISDSRFEISEKANNKEKGAILCPPNPNGGFGG